MVAQSPFAKHAGCVTGLLEHFGYGYILGQERGSASVGTYGCMAGVHAGHQYAPGRGTYAVSGVDLRKTRTFRRHLIQMGRTDSLLPVASKMAVSQIVRHDENDVRRLGAHIPPVRNCGDYQRQDDHREPAEHSLHVTTYRFT